MLLQLHATHRSCAAASPHHANNGAGCSTSTSTSTSSTSSLAAQRWCRRGRRRSSRSRAAAAATTTSSPAGRAVVVGGGPAGCLCASLLAKRGWSVDVFEARPEPCPTDPSTHRSYPMVLTSRSVMGFHEAGLQLPLAQPLAAIYMQNGPLNMLWEDSDWCRQYIVDRGVFGRHMYEAARAQYPGIQFHFGSSLTEVDFERRVATFASTSSGDPGAGPSSGSGSTSGAVASVSYELLVGADGAGSRVRQLLQAVVPELSTHCIFFNKSTYKTYHGLQCTVDEGTGARVGLGVPGFSGHDHSTNLYSFNKPGHPTLVVWKQADGSCSGMLTRAASYDAATLREAIGSAYPQIPQPWVEGIVAQTCDASGQPPSPFGKLLSVAQLHGPRCILAGDAGHPITSTLAQGCNLALESVRVFARVLDEVGGDPEAAPAAFTAARLRDVRAMQAIEHMQILCSNAPGAAAPPLERLAARATMLGSAALSLGAHKLGLAAPPVYLLAGLRDARVPYAEVLRTMQLQAAAMGALLAAFCTVASRQAVSVVEAAGEAAGVF